MPDTHDPAPSQKLGGIPLGQSPGVYRKPPAFKMRAVPRSPDRPPARAGRSSVPGVVRFLLGVAILGSGVYMFIRQQPNLVALIRQKIVTVQQNAAVLRPKGIAPGPAAVAPADAVDTTPLVAASEGWVWLFSEDEWRAVGDRRRESKDGLLHVRGSFEKPQPAPDGAIRARVVVREGAGSASVVLRKLPDGSRYRLMITPDLRFVRLLHEDTAGPHELGKYRLYKALMPGDRVLLELRAEGSEIAALVNGATVIEAKGKRGEGGGTWGVDAGDAWFELVEVPVPKVEVVAEAAPATPAPGAEPAPAMPAATPAPPTPPPQSETAKWLANLESQWKATYEHDVVEPFEKGVADLKKQYAASLEPQLAAATQAKKLDDAAAFRGEGKRVAAGEDVPEKDESIVPATLKKLRTGYRASYAGLDKTRFDRAKALFARSDMILAQNQAALIQRKRTEEALEIKAQREKLSAAWLKPPASAAPAPAPPSATPAAATPPPKPALGSAMTPPALVKMPARQVAEKLFAAGAGVWINQRGNASSEVKSLTEILADRFTFTRVEFRPTHPDESATTTADLAILDQLSEVQELILRAGPAVTDEILAKLRGFRTLKHLTLDGAQVTTASYAVLLALPELRELELRSLSTNDEAMKTIGQLHRLKALTLASLPIGDDALAAIGKLPALEELDLGELEKVTSAGIAHLPDCKDLRRVSFGGMQVTSSMIAALARCANLDSLNVSGNPLKDADVAPLSALKKMKSLNLNGTSVSGSVFVKWPARSSFTALSMDGAPGVNDEAVKAIVTAFPKLEQLDFTAAASGLTAAGFASLDHLRSLRALHIAGDAVNDEAAAHLAKCDNLESLNIPAAHLTDAGVAALAKLPRLNSLNLALPPITDAALKSFSKCKALKNISIGQDAPPEIEEKLKSALPAVTVTR